MNEADIIQCVNPRNFVNLWFKMLPEYPTYVAAYEALEVKYSAVFGRRKYSGYKSFEVVKNRMLRG